MTSLWLSHPLKQYEPIKETKRFDCVIIGGGLSGLACAYELYPHISSLAVIEANTFGFGASGRSTGKLSAQHKDCYHKILNRYGKASAKQFYLDQMHAISKIETIVQTHQIDCDFERCSSFLYNETSDPSQLNKEKEAYDFLNIPYQEHSSSSFPPHSKDALEMFNQARFHPIKYIAGLLKVLEQEQVSLYEHSPVLEIKKQENNEYQLRFQTTCISAKYVILATQYPILDDYHFYFARLIAYQATVFAYPNQPTISHMYLNMSKQVHSISMNQSTLLFCGNSHRVGQQKQNAPSLHQDAFQLFQLTSPAYEWTTSDYMSIDELPLIGPLSQEENLYFTSGYCKWGNATSHLAAELLAHQILHHIDERCALYDPHRHIPIFTSSFIKENLATAFAFISGRIFPSDIQLPEKLHASSVLIDQHHYGIYHHSNDQYYIVDIVCPHMGCICKFNDADKTWDCPCHGSRYSYKGDLLKGPSSHSLCPYQKGNNPIDPHINIQKTKSSL